MWQKLKEKIKSKLKEWLDCDCNKKEDIKVVNILDGEYISNHLSSDEGRKIIINTISKNTKLIKNSLGE